MKQPKFKPGETIWWIEGCQIIGAIVQRVSSDKYDVYYHFYISIDSTDRDMVNEEKVFSSFQGALMEYNREA